MQVVQYYTTLNPNNPLAAYLPALKKLVNKGDKFTGLTGFIKVVESLVKDPRATALLLLMECRGFIGVLVNLIAQSL